MKFDHDHIAKRLKLAKLHAEERGLEFKLTPRDIQEMLELQQGKCYYSHIVFENDPESKFNYSIDRKDSKQGYIRENVVLCCTVINVSKGKKSAEAYMARVRKEATDAFRVAGLGAPSEKDLWGFLY